MIRPPTSEDARRRRYSTRRCLTLPRCVHYLCMFLHRGARMSFCWVRALRLVLAPAPVTSGGVHAQAPYPNHPIKLVVPYPPAALTDLLARAIGERLAANLKQPVVIENKPGAGTL